LRKRVHEPGLQQAPLVMALLGPRIREVDVDACQRLGRDHVRNDVDGVVLDHANVGQARRVDAVEQCADAGAMHFEGQEIAFGMCCGNGCRRLAHAEADLQDDGRTAAERSHDFESLRRVRDSQARQQHVERALLRRETSCP
jgi:hypothetical protein